MTSLSQEIALNGKVFFRSQTYFRHPHFGLTGVSQEAPEDEEIVLGEKEEGKKKSGGRNRKSCGKKRKRERIREGYIFFLLCDIILPFALRANG